MNVPECPTTTENDLVNASKTQVAHRTHPNIEALRG